MTVNHLPHNPSLTADQVLEVVELLHEDPKHVPLEDDARAAIQLVLEKNPPVTTQADTTELTMLLSKPLQEAYEALARNPVAHNLARKELILLQSHMLRAMQAEKGQSLPEYQTEIATGTEDDLTTKEQANREWNEAVQCISDIFRQLEFNAKSLHDDRTAVRTRGAYESLLELLKHIPGAVVESQDSLQLEFKSVIDHMRRLEKDRGSKQAYRIVDAWSGTPGRVA